jgi:hypothetical protein
LGSYDHGLSEDQLVELEEAFREAAELFSSLRQSTDLAQATLLLYHNLPDRKDQLEQHLQELCRVRFTVEELLALAEELRALVEELQGVIDDPS